MPATRLDPEVLPEVQEGGDSDRFAHFAKHEDIVRANVEGGTVTALCGYEFPPIRDASRYPVCPKCKELVDMAEQLS